DGIEAERRADEVAQAGHDEAEQRIEEAIVEPARQRLGGADVAIVVHGAHQIGQLSTLPPPWGGVDGGSCRERRGTCGEPWWCTIFQASPCRRNTLVATTAPTMASPPAAVERMCSTQTTQASSPRTSMRSSATSKRMLAVLAK